MRSLSRYSLLLRSLFSLPLAFILCLHLLKPGCRSFSTPTDVFFDSLFGAMDFDNRRVYILTVENIAYIVVFHLLFGSHISEHFRYGCVYVFSRLHNRTRWYLRRVAEILLCCLLYSSFYIMSVLLICCNAASGSADSFLLVRVLLVFLFSFVIMGTTTVLTNLLSLRYGTAPSIFITEFLFFGLIAILTLTYKNSFLVLANPVAFLNLFNNGVGPAVFTVFYNLFLLLLTIILGLRYIQKYDVALFDHESI